METQQMQVIEQYQAEATELESKALSISVSSDLEAVKASEMAASLKGRENFFKQFFDPMVDAAHKSWKLNCDRRNLVLSPITRALKIINDRVASYQWTKQQQAEAAERKARIEAEEKEAKERARLEAEAREAKKAGKIEEATSLKQQARSVYVPPKPVAQVVKTGTSLRFVWDVEVLDKAKVPDKYKVVDESMLKRLVTADPDLKVPGVKFIKRASGSTRAA